MKNGRAVDRASGALMGVAIGDAMGMPSQTLSREQIRRVYGAIEDLTDAVSGQPVSGGLKAGTITDDTEQSLLLAKHILDRHGRFDEAAWARTLLDWEKDTRARGVNDLLGPSTRRAIEALLRGVPASETGRFGRTNGAAMRIVPVGISRPLEPLAQFVTAVEATCRLTHNTSEAIGSAAAVAAIVSAGVEGASFEEAVPSALGAAREGERRGVAATSGSIASRIETALDLASGRSGSEAATRTRPSDRVQRGRRGIRAHGLRHSAPCRPRTVDCRAAQRQYRRRHRHHWRHLLRYVGSLRRTCCPPEGEVRFGPRRQRAQS